MARDGWRYLAREPPSPWTQAEWLASYYTGQDRSAIQQLNFVTSFSDEYPEVNRLLPVYRVEFAGEDGIVAFIHTETGALASLSNNFKTNVQWLFQHLHTFKWLDSLESGRLITVAFFMLSLLATGVVGILLVFNLKSRKIPNTNRRYHRRLSYIAWLPLLAWSASGFYHLMQASLVETQFGLRLGEPYVALEAGDLNTDSLSQLSDESLNSLALVRNADQQLYWRASIARDSSQEAGDRAGRFAGNPSERAAMYLPATTSSTNTSFEDSQLAEFLALSFTGASADQVTGVSQIRGFGAGYDFRNKRLPVWKIDLNDEQGTSVFIDTATGILVDSNRAIDRAETWSFGILHKWNHLTGLTGPQIRDMLIVLTILMLLAINVFGIPLLLKKKPKKAAPAEVSPEQPVPA